MEETDSILEGTDDADERLKVFILSSVFILSTILIVIICLSFFLACNQPNLESLNQENKISSDNSVLYSPGILDATGTLEPKLCPVHGTLMEIIPTPETVCEIQNTQQWRKDKIRPVQSLQPLSVFNLLPQTHPAEQ
ncbi:uncharacterized protein LOC111695232 [Eurytemora carolleeae]|uniref:uncharacterized protein LOC111695232 n=1 Tax=Eurytemora carolleeae TaxID=1294199 RepID=UPI000C76467C|nr:uncharacterized protein LOC111695232 [Eurytemora carolleeae]|eukprot:XP_023320228.1 uncharacterized protein LOC111695232 [Eurytemora affinis]